MDRANRKRTQDQNQKQRAKAAETSVCLHRASRLHPALLTG
jgi:hypothetical protein